MRILAFFFITIFLGISSSESKYTFAPVLTNCKLLLPVKNYSQTVFFDMDVHAYPEITTCILKNSISDVSVLILNSNVNLRDNVSRDFMMTGNNPNVIITTTYLTTRMFDSLQWKFCVRSNWSLLYIVVTGDSEFKCESGKMSTKDFSLLENILNTLWHKFQIMRVGVVFPHACQQKMVIYNGKRSSTQTLYDRSIKLINATNYNDLYKAVKKSGDKLAQDYPIMAGLFYRYPTSITDCTNLNNFVHVNLNLTLGFCGLDGLIMHDILSHLKFNVSFFTDENCNDYGYETNGTVNGALGCILRNELDISFNSRFMTLYSNEQLYYLHYVTTDTLCALIKKPGIVPLWHGAFNLFSTALWALIGAVLVAIGGIMWATATINKAMAGPKTMKFWWYFYDSVTTTILGYSLMKTKALLMIRSACLMGSIFFVAIYMGHISRVYTTVKHFQSMHTLKDLYFSDAILYTSPSMRKFMRHLQNPEDKLQERFFDRAYLTVGDRLGVIVSKPSVATIDRKSDAEMSIMEQYSDDHGTPLIDIVNECFYTYYLSYVARSGFPFVEDLRVIIERLNEAGLPSKYYKWTQNMLEIPNLKPEKYSEARNFAKIRLTDQRVAFGILFVGTILSAVVFAAEMWTGRHKHLKQLKRRS